MPRNCHISDAVHIEINNNWVLGQSHVFITGKQCTISYAYTGYMGCSSGERRNSQGNHFLHKTKGAQHDIPRVSYAYVSYIFQARPPLRDTEPYQDAPTRRILFNARAYTLHACNPCSFSRVHFTRTPKTKSSLRLCYNALFAAF